jgi:hypothetical protein
MNRKKISFDCDGVIAEGGWIDVPDRTNKFYAAKQPLPQAVGSLHWLSTMYDIYVISTRGHENANLGLRAWLHWILGLELDTIAGVITYPGTKESIQGNPNAPMDKATIVRDLGIVSHFDDDPKHVAAMPGIGVLFPSEMPYSQAAINVLPTAPDWETVRAFLTTPGMELHGSDGASVLSPADTEMKEYPTVDVANALKVM